jgi:hypothetical protein
VQGQYHPDLEAKHLALRAKARTVVEAVCGRHPNARYLGVEKTLAFAVEDYRDATHVTPEAGTRFVEALLARLESMEAGVSPAQSSREPVMVKIDPAPGAAATP